MKKIAILFGVLLGLCCSAMAQTRTLLMSDGSTMINCGDTINFYDDGGLLLGLGFVLRLLQ